MDVRRPGLRVALISSSFHPYAGGVEEHVRHVARELREAGDTVEVWTVDRGEHLGCQVLDDTQVRYLPTPLPARSAGALGRFAMVTPRAIATWRGAYRDFRPDILHVQCFGPNGVYALALNQLTGTPMVVTSHGETMADDHGVYDHSAMLRGALTASLRRAFSVTAPTGFVLEDLRRRFGLVGGEIVPNGVDLQVTSARKPPWSFSSSSPPPVIFAVGRLERMKGFDLLLDAVAQTNLPNVHVVIGGDGSALPGLRSQADRLGLAARTHFLGRLTNEEVAAGMAAAEVIVVPSRREAFGIVALEAWRAGTPLVGTPHGGISEFVTDGVDGLIVDPLDADALGVTIRRLLEDGDLATRLTAAGGDRVKDFSWEAVATLYRSIYRSLQKEPS